MRVCVCVGEAPRHIVGVNPRSRPSVLHGNGYLVMAYLHYRLRTLYRWCGKGAPHADERPGKSKKNVWSARTRRRQQLSLSEDGTARNTPALAPLSSTDSLSIPQQPEQSRALALTSSSIPMRPRCHAANVNTQSLEPLFSLYKRHCWLWHAVYVDLSDLAEQHSRKPLLPSGMSPVPLPQPNPSVPATVSHAYA